MKIELTYGTDYDDLRHEEMSVETENRTEYISVYPLCECPEDAIIGRDLISCYEILDLIKLAYEAGKNGESFTIIEKEEDEEE